MAHPIASLQLHKKKTGKVGRQAAGLSGLGQPAQPTFLCC
jgi:hypothetical protein